MIHKYNFSQDNDGDTKIFEAPSKKSISDFIKDLLTAKSPPLMGTCYMTDCTGFTGYFPFVYNNKDEGKNYYKCPECGELVNDHIVEVYFQRAHLSHSDLYN